MIIRKVEKSNVTGHGDINDNRKITETNNFYNQPSYWGGFVSGIIASLIASAIWYCFVG